MTASQPFFKTRTEHGPREERRSEASTWCLQCEPSVSLCVCPPPVVDDVTLMLLTSTDLDEVNITAVDLPGQTRFHDNLHCLLKIWNTGGKNKITM